MLSFTDVHLYMHAHICVPYTCTNPNREYMRTAKQAASQAASQAGRQAERQMSADSTKVSALKKPENLAGFNTLFC